MLRTLYEVMLSASDPFSQALLVISGSDFTPGGTQHWHRFAVPAQKKNSQENQDTLAEELSNSIKVGL